MVRAVGVGSAIILILNGIMMRATPLRRDLLLRTGPAATIWRHGGRIPGRTFVPVLTLESGVAIRMHSVHIN